MNQRHPYISTCVVWHLWEGVKQGVIIHTKKREQQVHTAVFTAYFIALHTSCSVLHACQPNQAPELTALAQLKQAPLGYRPLCGWVGKWAEIAEEQTELSFWKASRSVTKYDLHNLRRDRAVYSFVFMVQVLLPFLSYIVFLPLRLNNTLFWEQILKKISEITFQVPTLINYNHN